MGSHVGWFYVFDVYMSTIMGIFVFRIFWCLRFFLGSRQRSLSFNDGENDDKPWNLGYSSMKGMSLGYLEGPTPLRSPFIWTISFEKTLLPNGWFTIPKHTKTIAAWHWSLGLIWSVHLWVLQVLSTLQHPSSEATQSIPHFYRLLAN